MKEKIGLLFLSLMVPILIFCQDVKIENLQASPNGRLTFEYTISQSHSARERYEVKIFTSADEFKQPLKIAQSDIPPGVKQTVSFLGSDHLPSGYSGALRIRVVAEAIIYPIVITNYSKKAKSGKALQLQWKDPSNRGKYDVVLSQNGQDTKLAGGVTGSSYSGDLPESLTKGSYQLKVFPTGDANSASDEMPVVIAGKMGMGIKILGAVAAGGVGIMAAGGGGGGGSGSGDLPGPPSTPDN